MEHAILYPVSPPSHLGMELYIGTVDAVYYHLDGFKILKYDLNNSALLMIDPPPRFYPDILITAEDSHLEIANLRRNSLHLWSWQWWSRQCCSMGENQKK